MAVGVYAYFSDGKIFKNRVYNKFPEIEKNWLWLFYPIQRESTKANFFRSLRHSGDLGLKRKICRTPVIQPNRVKLII